jgi:hypothetical protein
MSSENQFLVTVSGVDGFFATKTGGDPTVSITKDYDGGSDEADISYSRTTWSDIVIGRRYDVARDAAIALALQSQLRSERTVTVQPTDGSFAPIGPAQTLRCVLIGATSPAVNANGSTPARFQLTLAVKGLA